MFPIKILSKFALYDRFLSLRTLRASASKLGVGVFCTDKIQDDQDCAFLFRGGLANYKAYYGLSWFRPLLRGNSPMSSGLILKMNIGYNGVSRELEKFVKWRRNDLIPPCLKGRGPFIDWEAIG
jgi:hypothetical protein